MNDKTHHLKILRLPEVIKITGRSRSSIYSDISKGCFPSPKKIGPRAIGWVENDVTTWLENCPYKFKSQENKNVSS